MADGFFESQTCSGPSSNQTAENEIFNTSWYTQDLTYMYADA